MPEKQTFKPGDPRQGGVDAASPSLKGASDPDDIPDMGPTPFDESGNVRPEVMAEATETKKAEPEEPEVIERVIDAPAPPTGVDPLDAALEEAVEAGASEDAGDVDLNLVSADELEAEEVPDQLPDEEPQPRPVVPQVEHAGTIHACGLPTVLMSKKTMSEYLRRHRVEMRHRKAMEYNAVERRLYEVYVLAMRNKRAQKSHFVAALRLWTHGYPINPQEHLDLNSIKVGE
jgi:hypothetical protein